MKKYLSLTICIVGTILFIYFTYKWSLRDFKIEYVPYGKSGYNLHEGLLSIISFVAMIYGWWEYRIYSSAKKINKDEK